MYGLSGGCIIKPHTHTHVDSRDFPVNEKPKRVISHYRIQFCKSPKGHGEITKKNYECQKNTGGPARKIHHIS